MLEMGNMQEKESTSRRERKVGKCVRRRGSMSRGARASEERGMKTMHGGGRVQAGERL